MSLVCQSTVYFHQEKKWRIKKCTLPFWKWVILVDVLFLTVLVSLYSTCLIIWKCLFILIWIFGFFDILKWIHSHSHRYYPKIKYSSDNFMIFVLQKYNNCKSINRIQNMWKKNISHICDKNGHGKKTLSDFNSVFVMSNDLLLHVSTF